MLISRSISDPPTTSGEEATAIGRESDAPGRIAVPLEPVQFLPVGRVPQPYGPVLAGGRRAPAIGGERHTIDQARLHPAEPFLPAGYVPEPRRSIPGAGEGLMAVGRKSHALD